MVPSLPRGPAASTASCGRDCWGAVKSSVDYTCPSLQPSYSSTRDIPTHPSPTWAPHTLTYPGTTRVDVGGYPNKGSLQGPAHSFYEGTQVE